MINEIEVDDGAQPGDPEEPGRIGDPFDDDFRTAARQLHLAEQRSVNDAGPQQPSGTGRRQLRGLRCRLAGDVVDHHHLCAHLLPVEGEELGRHAERSRHEAVHRE